MKVLLTRQENETVFPSAFSLFNPSVVAWFLNKTNKIRNESKLRQQIEEDMLTYVKIVFTCFFLSLSFDNMTDARNSRIFTHSLQLSWDWVTSLSRDWPKLGKDFPPKSRESTLSSKPWLTPRETRDCIACICRHWNLLSSHLRLCC